MEENVVYCPSCGTQNSETHNYCVSCGEKLVKPSQAESKPKEVYVVATPKPVSSESDNPPTPVYSPFKQPDYYEGIDPDLASLVGNKQEYYLPHFRKFLNSEVIVSWNWCAFFFNPYWAFYRRMYGFGIGYLLFVAVCIFIAVLFAELIGAIALVALLLPPVFSGMFSNYFYLGSLQRKLDRLNTQGFEGRIAYINKYGGTSVIALVVSMVVVGGVVSLLFAFGLLATVFFILTSTLFGAVG
ncbi:MAG: DUF2628 domain-containing protein [Eggerthellaceae bacterium]|nr:DUF2628 domain-containing protein [Eggerthellaceae bacterium]